MELKQLCKQHHFTLTQIRPIPGIDAELVQMVYEKTGTELCWVKSQERNKLFGIAFKTIPEDDTGVFHILEHSVLCGSAKYPVKEPFVEMLKSSMNTFLNAMTFPDKTVYPISSRNDQDFLNLTEVYLDAVFAPKILENSNIFRQEGWHYELQDGNLIYNGVVFNEMKGAMSSVDQASYRGLMKVLYPDLCYSYNSGGDPTAIPNLTYEQFIDSYRKNYHPTNARVFLDGDIPVEKTLALLDEYLSRYEMGEKQALAPQKPTKQEQTIYYEATNDGTPKAQLLLGKILGTFDDKLGLLARQVLCDVLAGSNDAPLKRAILETGLCQDVSLNVEDGMIQPFMMLRLHNIEDENSAKLESAVRACAEKLVAEGIEKDRLVASINRFIFNLQQMKEPQGLIRGLNCMNAWLYDGDPMLYLHFEDCFGELRAMAENYIEYDCVVCGVMDARANQVYNAFFDITGGKVRRICKDRAISIDDLSEEIKKISQNVNKRVIIVGDGTDVFFPAVKNIPCVIKSEEAKRYQNACGIATASVDIFRTNNTVSPDELLPTYLRLPQAERELKKKRSGENL